MNRVRVPNGLGLLVNSLRTKSKTFVKKCTATILCVCVCVR